MKYLTYLWYVVRHKWFVFLECCKLGIPLLGILHDWSKLLPGEFLPYARFFGRDSSPRDEMGYYKPTDTGDSAFDFAWILHTKRNRHHWQFWILPEDSRGLKVLPIPDRYRKEMLADWRGAGRAQGTPDTLAWWAKNKHKLGLHSETRRWIEYQLFLAKVAY